MLPQVVPSCPALSITGRTAVHLLTVSLKRKASSLSDPVALPCNQVKHSQPAICSRVMLFYPTSLSLIFARVGSASQLLSTGPGTDTRNSRTFRSHALLLFRPPASIRGLQSTRALKHKSKLLRVLHVDLTLSSGSP